MLSVTFITSRKPFFQFSVPSWLSCNDLSSHLSQHISLSCLYHLSVDDQLHLSLCCFTFTLFVFKVLLDSLPLCYFCSVLPLLFDLFFPSVCAVTTLFTLCI
ncbi:hypothetical protein CHARACLAT_008183 [Characodon lateralis]|uniref:Uncharacterized protein n=1 Tax=Characodon lateralis TaxID=208331 RepID=A0ABU7F163_9TELE|nr:hypothetical protein [Characodon lateralis]